MNYQWVQFQTLINLAFCKKINVILKLLNRDLHNYLQSAQPAFVEISQV